MITGKVNLIDLFNSMDEEEKEEFVKILINEINNVQKKEISFNVSIEKSNNSKKLKTIVDITSDGISIKKEEN